MFSQSTNFCLKEIFVGILETVSDQSLLKTKVAKLEEEKKTRRKQQMFVTAPELILYSRSIANFA